MLRSRDFKFAFTGVKAMEGSIIHMVVGWVLARLSERNTWETWIGVAAVKLGVTINPAFDTLLVNILLAVVATLGYAIEGKPLWRAKK